MDRNYERFQPDLATQIKEQVASEVLAEKLTAERQLLEQEAAGEDAYSQQARELRVQKQRLNQAIREADGRAREADRGIERLVRACQASSDCYPGYERDLAANLNRRTSWAAAYRERFSALMLNKPADAHPADWFIDYQGIELKDTQRQVTHHAFVSRKDAPDAERPSASLGVPFAPVDLYCYYRDPVYHAQADGSLKANDSHELVTDSFLLYWAYDAKEESLKTPMDAKNGAMWPVGLGYINHSGQLIQATPISEAEVLDIDLTAARDRATVSCDWGAGFLREFFADRQPDLFRKPTGRARRGQGRDPETVQNLFSLSDFNETTRYGFLLYPADCGRFTTRELLAELANGERFKNLVRTGTLAELDYQDGAQGGILLHCTLPEWNRRLLRQLKALQAAQHRWAMANAPHEEKRNILIHLKDQVNLQLQFPYDYQSDDNIQRKRQLLDQLDTIQAGIDDLVAPPHEREIESLKALGYDYHNGPGEIDEQAELLYELLAAKELEVELSRYLEHPGALPGEGQPDFGPGPYMEEEQGWWTILQTIATAYAALADTPYAELLWERDIRQGLEFLCFRGELGDVLEEVVTSGRNELLVTQLDELLTSEEVQPKGLLASVLVSYKATKDGFLSHVVRGAGAPCMLQVVLDCYGNYVSRLIASDLLGRGQRHDRHIRLLNGVMYTFGMLNFPLERGDSLSMSMNKAVVGRAPARNQIVETKDDIAVFLKKRLDDEGLSEMAYGQIDEVRSAYGKSIYALLNLAVLAQAGLVRQEAGKEPMASDEFFFRTASVLADGAVQSLALAKSVLVITANPPEKDVTKSAKPQPVGTRQAGQFVETFTNQADRLATLGGLLAVTVALYDIAKLMKEPGNGEAVAWKGLEALSGLMIQTGYGLKELAKRRAAQAVATAVARETAVLTSARLPWVGQVLLVSGTVITGLMLVKDGVSALYHWAGYTWFFDDNRKRIDQLWGSFTASEALPLTDPVFRQLPEIERAAYPAYQKTYRAYFATPLEKTEKLFEGNWIGWGDVDWGQLSWRAVIPLYTRGYSREAIEGRVRFPSFMKSEISSVGALIAYFEALKECQERREGAGNGADEIPAWELVDALCSGDFDPADERSYFGKERWQDLHLHLPATEQGVGAPKFDSMKTL